MNLILQTSGSFEVRTLLTYALINDLDVVRASLATLVKHEDNLNAGYLPVGSVEFMREAMKLLGVREPSSISYPGSLSKWFRREIQCVPKYLIERGDCFLKPAGKTKLFSGFVRTESKSNDPVEQEYRNQQEADFAALPDSAPMFVCSIVHFSSEWRYYILNDKIVGFARYDDSEDEADAPSEKVVKSMVLEYKKKELGRPVAYSLDVGILSSGETALVELNDGWGLGLYRGMTDTPAYLNMLAQRWAQLTGIQAR